MKTQNHNQLSSTILTRDLFGTKYAIVDYETASDVIIAKAVNHISYGVSALAVHGLITGIQEKNIGEKIRSIDMIVPDGQPIRWALNHFHDCKLKDRVRGTTLTLHVLRKANNNKLKIYLYGSTKATIENLQKYIQNNFPQLYICGLHVDRFRAATPSEDEADIKKINDSQANIVLVGRGCPRQEVWVADHHGKINAAMMAVGAVFDFLSGNKKQAPVWMQDRGLEWLYRLMQEPRRLWKRNLTTNSRFIFECLKCELMGKYNESRSGV